MGCARRARPGAARADCARERASRLARQGALTWGMTFKVETAGECCDACRAHHRLCGPGKTGSVFWRRTWEGKVRCAAAAAAWPPPIARPCPHRRTRSGARR